MAKSSASMSMTWFTLPLQFAESVEMHAALAGDLPLETPGASMCSKNCDATGKAVRR
jgi:hypothetical protein